MIFKQSLNAIEKEEMLSSFADELKLDLELSEKIKEKISSHDPLDECQREVQGQKLGEITKIQMRHFDYFSNNVTVFWYGS